ncbi:2-hydroxycarboxylate transporter family protein [Clostridium sp. SHJSY1]|uniref:2-hydroxycarboxylate transporter family protein n=1 Tax=Clostridium sp. SHJSY1 TaxID=2942483 RepID=UPI00287432DC|nr:2-hydroxycarboxylate transporter family protein [Clostridium sp. SHJSY1]MDS0526476.1 2-hydroxycarboxylate transporter family protein [Clostridium sp. SHJSY1]
MKKEIRIGNLPLKYYIPFAAIILIATYTGTLNKDIVGATAFLLTTGWLFSYIGGIIPIFGSFMGGAVLLPLFAGSALVYYNLIPKYVVTSISGLMSSGSVNIFIAAIVVGSILSMDRKMLISVTLRLLPIIIGSLIFAFGFIYLGTVITGKSLLDGIFMTGLPNYTGGSSGALVVIPTIYSEIFNQPAGVYSGKLIVFMNISNLICVILSGLLNKLGKKYPSLTGNGTLIKGQENVIETKEKISHDMEKDITKLGTGLIISVVFLIFGNIMQALVPQLNFIAWAAVLVIIVKATGFLSEDICLASGYWQGFVIKVFLPFLITGVGISSLDLGQLASYFTISNFIIILFGVIGAMLGSLIVGRLFKLYPIDAMIVIGANMGTVGGSGAVATLSTAERMEMMPFSIIANRIGGAIIVVVISLLIPYFI